MGMKVRFLSVVVTAALAFLAVSTLAQPTLGQGTRDLPSAPTNPPATNPPATNPPATNPAPGRGSPAVTLDTLFNALKIAPDEASAKAIEERIWAIWISSGGDTCNLLMSRVKDATDDRDYDLAIKLLDAIVTIRPDYVEAWNRRATLYYITHEYGRALADIHEVLAREPRHFGALAGLGLILQDIGDDKHALQAYQAALAIDPHLRNLPDTVKTLREKVEGRDI